MAEPAAIQPIEEAREVRFAVAPRNLTREEALAYTRWSPKFFDLMEKGGAIVGKPHGRNGQKIYSREQLDDVDRSLSPAGTPANDIDDEFGALGG